MADLHFQHYFQESAAGKTVVTVLGEDTAELSNDYQVALDVGTDKMNELLLITSEGTAPSVDADEKWYPTLDFKLLTTGIGQKIQDSGIGGLKNDMKSTSGAFFDFASVAGNASTKWVLEIPHEAIKKVEISDPVPTFANVKQDINVAGDSAEAAAGSISDGVRDFYEQVLAANRLNAIESANASTPQTTTFVDGDKISVYVQFSLSNSRSYAIDSATSDPNTAPTKKAVFTTSGGPKTLDVNGINLTSAAQYKIVKYTMTAKDSLNALRVT